MKKTLVLAALTAVSAGRLMADSDIYITGSTAFRANAFAACQKLYDSTPSINNGTSGTPASSDTSWTMSGTMNNLGVSAGTQVITIHAAFNGSVQGLHNLANKDAIVFVKTSTQGDSTTVTNTTSCAFSDVFSLPTISPLSSSSFTEKKVAVQPFVFVKSISLDTVPALNNVTWQQLQDVMGNGSAPLSYFTGNFNDYNTNVYLLHRTLDSGTRVTTVQESAYVGTPVINYYDPSTGTFIPATTNRGPATYGPGYVGGGDIKTALQFLNVGNTAIGYLSFSDAKGISSTNWGQVLAFNGQYPVVGETSGVALSGTNDFSPISTGKYSFWAFECLDWPKSSQFGTYSDQNITFTLLNNILNKLSGTGAGSIDNEIVASQNGGATALRLSQVPLSRPAVGGAIAP